MSFSPEPKHLQVTILKFDQLTVKTTNTTGHQVYVQIRTLFTTRSFRSCHTITYTPSPDKLFPNSRPAQPHNSEFGACCSTAHKV
nr:hypothetical protein [uncultured Methanocorpusculum sp.]